MGFISWIIVGLIAGFVAEKVTKSDHGLLTNLIIGLIGAVVGGYIANMLNLNLVDGFLNDLIVASGGAVLVLFIYKAVRR